MSEKRSALASGVAGWFFGLAATILLIGVWGRAVVTDTSELANSLSPLSTSRLVADRFAGWLETELVDSGVDRATAATSTQEAMASPTLTPILADLVAQAVMAAASTDPAGSVVDVASVLTPVAGEITVSLNEAGVPASDAQVAAAIAQLDPIVIRQPSQRALVGPASPLATRLGTAAILAIVTMLGAGAVYVMATEDRMAGIRSLLTRFALGALSFSIFLRIGSWITDPRGGRAPVGETVSLLTGSKWTVPAVMGLAAMAIAVFFWIFRRRIKPVAAFPSQPAPPTLPGAGRHSTVEAG
ncbi:MAG: hypothetical protein WBZ40_05675 [Acidimicrobiia bacterium]